MDVNDDRWENNGGAGFQPLPITFVPTDVPTEKRGLVRVNGSALSFVLGYLCDKEKPEMLKRAIDELHADMVTYGNE